MEEPEVLHDGSLKLWHNGIYHVHNAGIGRKKALVDCPFCNATIPVYVWSITGGGKKCDCGVILYRNCAVKKPEKSKK